MLVFLFPYSGDRLLQKGLFHRADKIQRRREKDKGDKSQKKKIKDASEKEDTGTGDDIRVSESVTGL